MLTEDEDEDDFEEPPISMIQEQSIPKTQERPSFTTMNNLPFENECNDKDTGKEETETQDTQPSPPNIDYSFAQWAHDSVTGSQLEKIHNERLPTR